MAQVFRLSGPILVGPDDARSEAWVLGGRITYTAPRGDHQVATFAGWVLPGLVDAHCHVGLDAHGAVDDERRRPKRRRTGTLARCCCATQARLLTRGGSTAARTSRGSSARAGT